MDKKMNIPEYHHHEEFKNRSEKLAEIQSAGHRSVSGEVSSDAACAGAAAQV